MAVIKAINTDRVIFVQQSGENVIVSIQPDKFSVDGMVIALARVDWDELVASVA